MIYLAGPLFSEAERSYLDRIADELKSVDSSCFVPHQRAGDGVAASAAEVFAADYSSLRDSNLLVAWLDGPSIDDGTACELAIFSEWMRTEPQRYRGIVVLVTDWRAQRRANAGLEFGDLNLFVTGLLKSAEATICWSLKDVCPAVRGYLDQGEPATSEPNTPESSLQVNEAM